MYYIFWFQLHLGPLLVGLMFLLNSFVYTAAAPFWGYFVDRTNHALKVMMFGAATLTLALLFIGPCPIFHIEKYALVHLR